MVCYGVFGEKISGSGIMDSLMKKFTAHKYPGENHAYSLDPKHIGQIITGLDLVLTFLLVKNYTMLYL